MNAARISLTVGAAICALASAVALAADQRLAPIPDEQSVSRHAPYEAGQCDVCHDADDKAGAPGRLLRQGDALCFDCHDEFRKAVKGHPAARDVKGGCVGCHSPHNSRKKKLLL